MVEIIVEGLCFDYDKTPVLHDINLRIERPGLYCIIGPNGVGKSTLVKCLNKLLTPTSGTVRIDGEDVREMRRKDVAEKIGFVPAASSDCFSMPVLDTILIGRHNHNKWVNTPQDLAIVHRAMSMLDLENLASREYNKLSAGQHQRVSLARGLVQETPVLLLDEPTANLDVRHQVYVAELLRALAVQEDLTIIMICHDLNIAARYAHEIIVMAPPGVIECQGTPDEVIREDVIRRVYGIDCQVIRFEDSPCVILKSTFPDDEADRGVLQTARSVGPLTPLDTSVFWKTSVPGPGSPAAMTGRKPAALNREATARGRIGPSEVPSPG